MIKKKKKTFSKLAMERNALNLTKITYSWRFRNFSVKLRIKVWILIIISSIQLCSADLGQQVKEGGREERKEGREENNYKGRIKSVHKW